MDKCEYKKILTEAHVEVPENAKTTWKPLLRQCMICCGIWCFYFMSGVFLGAPTVIVAQIRREANSSDAVSDEMSSWLSSMPLLTSGPFVIILSWLLYTFGRRLTYIMIGISLLCSTISFYFSSNVFHVILSQSFLGANSAAVNSFTPIIIAEYTSPKYRGIFLTVKSASAFWGIWVSNAIGTFFHWNNICIPGFLCATFMITLFAWPESPYWLATKGRYAACAKSHRFLKGVSDASEYELAELIRSTKREKISASLKRDNDFQFTSYLSSLKSTITSRSFYKPTILCIVLFSQYHVTGKVVISVYAIEVLKGVTNDLSVAYKAMLILDGVTVLSMYGGCILSRFFKRRFLILLFSGTGILFLFLLSLYLYLISLGLLNESHVLIIALLTVFSIAIGCGPMILASSIYGELVPSRYKTSTMIVCGLFSTTLMAVMLKLSPLMFRYLKMHGCFLLFAISSTIIAIILYVYLPETKDKTVSEIEEYFTGNKESTGQQTSLLHDKQLEK